MTTDYNVARVPANLSVDTAAALGVAFVSAILALSISLGFDFTTVKGGPPGPDLLQTARAIDREVIPDDVRDEVYSGITDEERPAPGDWFAIWGGEHHVQVFTYKLMIW